MKRELKYFLYLVLRDPREEAVSMKRELKSGNYAVDDAVARLRINEKRIEITRQ